MITTGQKIMVNTQHSQFHFFSEDIRAYNSFEVARYTQILMYKPELDRLCKILRKYLELESKLKITASQQKRASQKIFQLVQVVGKNNPWPHNFLSAIPIIYSKSTKIGSRDKVSKSLGSRGDQQKLLKLAKMILNITYL